MNDAALLERPPTDYPDSAGAVVCPPAFTVTDLCVRYGDKIACENVSLQIPQNQITAVMGPSGCGKSTFLCCLNQMATSNEGCLVQGNVCYKGQKIDVPGVELTMLRRKIGMVFQKPNPFPFSIWRNLELPLKRHGVRSREKIAARIEDALRRAQLWDEVSDRLHGSALKLSGGQQQRLCIARALVLEPEVLLLDEPCSALDPISSMKVEQLLLDLKADHTIVIVTHNIGQAKRLADFLAFFWTIENRGVLVETGRARETFANPGKELTAAFLAAEI
ncbi:MAG: phosphate ABC transporter ATP-binding protein [Aquisalimonadaceae bacterium]